MYSRPLKAASSQNSRATRLMATRSPARAGAVYWKPARKLVRFPGWSSSTWEVRAPMDPSPGRARPFCLASSHTVDILTLPSRWMCSSTRDKGTGPLVLFGPRNFGWQTDRTIVQHFVLKHKCLSGLQFNGGEPLQSNVDILKARLEGSSLVGISDREVEERLSGNAASDSSVSTPRPRLQSLALRETLRPEKVPEWSPNLKSFILNKPRCWNCNNIDWKGRKVETLMTPYTTSVLKN